jgi:hypothetical protein
VFGVVIPDNLKAIVIEADDLDRRLNPALLEYAQARGFVIDPARVRKPRTRLGLSEPSRLSGSPFLGVNISSIWPTPNAGPSCGAPGGRE